MDAAQWESSRLWQTPPIQLFDQDVPTILAAASPPIMERCTTQERAPAGERMEWNRSMCVPVHTCLFRVALSMQGTTAQLHTRSKTAMPAPPPSRTRATGQQCHAAHAKGTIAQLHTHCSRTALPTPPLSRTRATEQQCHATHAKSELRLG